MKTVYKVMINTWNGRPGISSDDFTDAYSGIEWEDEEEAKKELKEAREATKNNLMVNFCFIDKIEVYGSTTCNECEDPCIMYEKDMKGCKESEVDV